MNEAPAVAYVFVFGSLLEGFRCIGPFESEFAARVWANEEGYDGEILAVNHPVCARRRT